MNKNPGALALLLITLCPLAQAANPDKAPVPHPNGPSKPSLPLPFVQIAWPSQAKPAFAKSIFASSRQVFEPAAAVAAATPLYKKALNLKLLVLSADGSEPSYSAIKFFLDHIGIPYDAVVLNTAALPALTDLSGHGNYQGIVLANGQLAYNAGGVYKSALSTDDWSKIDKYQVDTGIRLVSYYTFPEARYGMALFGSAGYSSTPAAPSKLTFANAGKSMFPYLAAKDLDVVYSYYYPATAVAAAGETTTPILTISGPGVSNRTAAVTHVAADGRESLAMTFDSSQYLQHSLALHYGIFNWVTRGVFVGQRRIYLSPQSDDFFLPNDMFANSPAACKPSSFSADPTFDPAVSCPTDRVDKGDLDALVKWQNSWQKKAQFAGFQLTHAFNGFGTTTDGGASSNDQLKSEATVYKNEFYWLNHTWDHEHLDCFNPKPNSGICAPANLQQSRDELQLNIALAKKMGIPYEPASMVTPNISGLNNGDFLQAAKEAGIKYMVSDMSRPDWLPEKPNTGVYSKLQPSILYIPRRATNIFYNTKAANVGAVGSLTDEYNYFYGPNGLLRIGGPGGPPFYTTNQTYAQIIDGESNALLSYMLRGEWYPSMFHQSNLIRYKGSNSLFADVMDATMNKFAKLSNLPVRSLPQTSIGQMMADRMIFNKAGVLAVYTPGVGIALTASGPAKVPLTGVCAAGCSTYGGENQSMVPVTAAGPVTIPLK
jgi:hypothetical protein